MAYGTPAKDEDIEPYYTHIRHGKKPNEVELQDLKKRYAIIGKRSPLLEITQSTAAKLRKRLEPYQVQVYTGMKHWHPYISEEFPKIVSDGTADLLSVALAPHYSKMSIGGYQDSVREANKSHGDTLKLSFVDSWHLNPVFIDKWSQRIKSTVANRFGSREVYYLFTAHSLPERILAMNDPYKGQLLETSARIAKNLGLDRNSIGFAFQSAGHTSEPWLGPDILEKLAQLASERRKAVMVMPIGFVSDHLEILFDIDKEAQEVAYSLGIELARTESFNDSDDFIDILESVVRESGFLSQP